MIEKMTPKKLAQFVLPSILLMVFIAIYTVVDSIFIARIVGSSALAGLNICMPLYSIAFACGIMFAAGGGAIIAIKLGRGRVEEAGRNFTSLLIVGAGFGIIAAVACLVFREPLISVLGADGEIKKHAMIYGIFMMITFPFMITKVILESLLRVDGKPRITLYMTILGGLINVLLDYIFMVQLDMGIAGAGLGTLLGIVLSLPVGFLHFFSDKSTLKLILSKPEPRFLLDTVINGSSEMVNEAAIAVSTIIFNMLAIKYLGNEGLAAMAVILGLNFLNTSVVFGFVLGVSPIISFNYGRGNSKDLNSIIRYSLMFILMVSLLFFVLNFVFADFMVGIYIDEESPVYQIAVAGLKLYSISYLFSGIDLFGTAFFTAFGNGRISAVISFTKSFVIFIISAWILPVLLGAEGIWLIRPVTQLSSVFLVIYFMKKYQNKYDYQLAESILPCKS